MHSFKDQAGRDWMLSIDCDTIERIAATTGLDLASPFDGEPSLQQKIALHIPTQVKLLWALCREQAEKSQMTRGEFEAALRGILPAAVEALHKELSDFFQHWGMTEVAMILRKSIDLIEQGKKLAMARMDSEASSNVSSGSAPESAASTPDDSH